MSRAASILSAASFLGIAPHIVEDFAEGVHRRFGLTFEVAAWLFGLAVAAQALAALGAARGRRPALVGVLVLGIGWAIAAAADHPGAFTPGGFRHGLSSRAWVWLIVAAQLAAAAAAARALAGARGGPRTDGG